MHETEPLLRTTTLELWGAQYELPDIELPKAEGRGDLPENAATLERKETTETAANLQEVS